MIWPSGPWFLLHDEPHTLGYPDRGKSFVRDNAHAWGQALYFTRVHFANVLNLQLCPFLRQNPAEGPPHHGSFHPWCSTERHTKRYNPQYNLAD
jgi:hypothetical protein